MSSQNDKWEFYQDSETKWRWRRTASNGRIVGASTQGYVNKSDCIANARLNGYTG
ncbi:YegP family protein [Chryseobacterium sp. T20]|uniref:YegP family protein n=1 Tax=Chryseobacterium sp. T20 TaxID=3395375 RepID=UPI0039BCD002